MTRVRMGLISLKIEQRSEAGVRAKSDSKMKAHTKRQTAYFAGAYARRVSPEDTAPGRRWVDRWGGGGHSDKSVREGWPSQQHWASLWDTMPGRGVGMQQRAGRRNREPGTQTWAVGTPASRRGGQ